MDKETVLRFITACVRDLDGESRTFSEEEQTLLHITTNGEFSDAFRLAAARELARLSAGAERPATSRQARKGRRSKKTRTKKISKDKRTNGTKRHRMGAAQQSTFKTRILESVAEQNDLNQGAAKQHIRDFLNAKADELGFHPSLVQIDVTTAAMVKSGELTKKGERAASVYWISARA
ncbi:MAG: hypothetical protein KC503_37675 [Myxococcales bacterium]|nr:hypothetical protein [Myxococcales bacterium]